MKRLLAALLLLFNSQVNAIEIDKFKHLTAGLVISNVAGVETGCAAGVVKEAYDVEVDIKDFTYTCAGAIFGGWVSKKRGRLYALDTSLILLDGLSTSMAISNGAIEVGWLASRLFGKKPNTPQIATLTVINLGILEWSRHWHPYMRDAYQYTLLITRPGVISVNIQNSF